MPEGPRAATSYGDLPSAQEATPPSSREVVDSFAERTLLGRGSSGAVRDQKAAQRRDLEAAEGGLPSSSSGMTVETENTARIWDGLIRNFSTLLRAAEAGRSRTSQDTGDGDLSDDEWGPGETAGWCSASRVPCCHRVGVCYYCFLMVFASFFFVFPLFLKWMITSPMPGQYWNERYPEFPVLVQQGFITEGRARDNAITVTDIPRTWSGCNHTCSTNGGFTRASSEMNFQVEMTFNAAEYEHTAFPVLFASNDFSSWWLAADKRHAEPQPYFAEHTDQGQYSYATETCTRPPEVKYGEGEVVVAEDTFASVATYVLVCVTWSPDKVDWHRGSTELTADDLARRCDAVGGVCGVPCGANPGAAELPGCSGGLLEVDSASGTVAGVPLPGASFAGDVAVRACQQGADGAVGAGECRGSAQPMSQWPCHKCRNSSVTVDEDNSTAIKTLIYDSLPRMQAILENAPVGGSSGLGAGATPRAYFMSTPLDTSTQQPLGMQAGRTWKKLYDPMYYPLPEVVLPSAEGGEGAEAEGEGRRLSAEEPTPAPIEPWPIVDVDRHTMGFSRKNSVTLKPSWCFGERGPLYIVACAVNQSTYENGFVMGEGQSIAPPPFNDRCIAVSGKCGYACMEQQSPAIEHCDASGNIIFEDLLGLQAFEPPTNEGAVVGLFVWTLLLGFAVKILTYTPALFMPYKHAMHYTPGQTAKLKYIAVCVPSAGETKACVLRSIVGALSGLPSRSQCPFHVVFADEGHRHPQKLMFRALNRVLDAVPATPMTAGSMPPARSKSSVTSACVSGVRSGANSPRTPRTKSYRPMSSRAIKEENLKLFLKHWTEQTRAFQLATCNTEKMAKKIKTLREDLLGGDEAADGARDKDLLRREEASKKEIKSLEDMIDSLCGKNVLKLLQSRHGWPGSDSEEGREVRELEEAIRCLRSELTVGEKQVAGAHGFEDQLPACADDCEDHSWSPALTGPSGASDEEAVNARAPLYTMHYVARAKPEEDERTLKVQHVARGGWYYKVPFDEARRQKRSWLEWRRNIHEFQDGDYDVNKILVPVRTSRGKAGGLNFVENYLFQYHLRESMQVGSLDPVRFKPSLFSIADARHQFQPDFFHVSIPCFFVKGSDEVNSRVAFTQCPQYFPEMPDDVDYLDTNNSNFFRLNCMLRNCCGGVSSCGTNGTWLIRDRRAGVKGSDSIWETGGQQRMRAGFTQMFEYRFFHESCKVEDTASSLDRVVKGKYSQYINRKLSYGMAKDPVDYLAAIQRWAEGGVVLSLQTFLSCKEGIHMIWATFFGFLLFIASLGNMLYGNGSQGAINYLSQAVFGDRRLLDTAETVAGIQADLCIDLKLITDEHQAAYVEMFLEVEAWVVTVLLGVALVLMITAISNAIHHCTCCGRRRKFRRTRFPTSPSQWARLMITTDNLTYFLWFWTAFFWVGFNYYTVYGTRYYHFEPTGMVLFSWLLQVLSWSLILASSSRNNKDQGMQANEVFFLSLTNIWRTTQMFYITAPLTVYSIAMGFSDYFKNKMLGVDISYWAGGDRGAVSKSITQWWTLLLVAGTAVTWTLFATGWVAVDVGAALIITFIGLDVLHPCAFLWLGTEPEKLPAPPAKGSCPAWRRCVKRCCRLLVSSAFYRNILRSLIFHPRTAMTIKWIGPLQHVMMPVLTWFFPEMGVNSALLLLASVK